MARDKARCGCDLVQCDPCGQMVPRGETHFVSYENSGSAQSDTTMCAECRGADPQDAHPTCERCGSCDVCDCPDQDNVRVSNLLGEDLTR